MQLGSRPAPLSPSRSEPRRGSLYLYPQQLARTNCIYTPSSSRVWGYLFEMRKQSHPSTSSTFETLPFLSRTRPRPTFLSATCPVPLSSLPEALKRLRPSETTLITTGGRMRVCESLPSESLLDSVVLVRMKRCRLYRVRYADVYHLRVAVNAGYDGSLFNGLQTMPIFMNAIGHPDSSKLGIISAAYPLGG
jgi:hypothetical protein